MGYLCLYYLVLNDLKSSLQGELKITFSLFVHHLGFSVVVVFFTELVTSRMLTFAFVMIF